MLQDISREEFRAGCAKLNEHLPADHQLEDVDHMMDVMDFNKSGLIDLNEFFEVRAQHN